MVSSILRYIFAKAVSYTISTVVFGYVISIPLRYFFGCRIVGLTGSIASGKSTCMKVLSKYGGHIDMDVVGKLVQVPGFAGWANLRQTFGFQFFNPDGTVNSDALGRHIFGDRGERQKLNSALRWPILYWMLRDLVTWFLWHAYANRTSRPRTNIEPVRVVYLDAALLFEASLDWICDSTVVISVSEKTQLQRLKNRDNVDLEYAKKKISSQGSTEWKKKKASVVIDNNKEFERHTSPPLVAFAKEQLDLATPDPLVNCLIPTRYSFLCGAFLALIGTGLYQYYQIMFQVLEMLGMIFSTVSEYLVV